MNWIREHKLIVGIIAAVVVLAVICCISFSRGGGSGIAGKGTNGAVSAGEGAVTGGMLKIESIFSGIFNYRSVVDENVALREEVAKLEQQLLDEKMSNDQLKQLKDLSKALNYKAAKNRELVSADITSFDNSNWINIFVINRGASDGIAKDDVVVNGTGLVGRVLECGKSWSKIVSVVDENSNTSFMVSRDTEILGILSGDGRGGLDGYVLDADSGIIEGDVLLSSGMGMYPSGIEIGTVTAVNYNSDTQLKMITVKPSVNFRGILKVAVMI